MKPLEMGHFNDFFRELHGHDPYPWQRRLAEAALAGNWPPAIDLPTGSGKTACLDVAIFALACAASRRLADRTAPVRVFFCVNRRVIVDEACQRARKIARKLGDAEKTVQIDSILCRVAAALRHLNPLATHNDTPPLDVLELRGGIYRDNRWARSATQPTIICTTVDQLGSRLLFRGYGVSSNAAPIQAALIAYDSLILLDEAHISRPFLQTLINVRRYLDPEKWADRSIGVNPAVIVPMTATPPTETDGGGVIRLDDDDRAKESLRTRLVASKPAELRDRKDVVEAVVSAAKELAGTRPTAVGIIVNRIATAREVFKRLRDDQPQVLVELVIGSMRPIDRDRQAERLRDLIGPQRPAETTQASFVVATQCLEVGADYDFDALVTECASLDALRQRFGRLNRAGRDIEARAVILIEKKAIKPEDKLSPDKPEDPVYGNALAQTWNWLSRVADEGSVDFGVDAMDPLLAAHGDDGRILPELLAPSSRLDAPVMLPAYIDFWCQTSPCPLPEPDVALFLHGRQRGDADVQVCWRADLEPPQDEELQQEHWPDVLALLPPMSAECMTVGLSRVRQWLTDRTLTDQSSDLLGATSSATDDDEAVSPNRRKRSTPSYPCVLWRGPNEGKLVESPRDVRPGDTLVFPVSTGGWDELGYIPDDGEYPIDVAEKAFQKARDRAVLRLHPSLVEQFPERGGLIRQMSQGEDLPTAGQWRELLAAASDQLPSHAASLASGGFVCEAYPDELGVVLTSRQRLGTSTDWFLPALDDGDDAPSRISRRKEIPLGDHLRHVVDTLHASPVPISASDLSAVLTRALELHDLGKADERFQAMLRRTDRTDAWLLAGRSAALIAKSDGLALSPAARRGARERARLPDGFRHEMLSVQLAERTPDLPDDAVLRDLVLHLIAAHHGYARPFAPVVVDDAPPNVEVQGLSLTASDRLARPAHRLDSGIPERFWNLTRRFGWWGLAYLESLVRLADQQASAAEDAGAFDASPQNTDMESIP